ncbi:mitochondrial fission 1 protein [Engystomops pustulosus]|uniref:mitochondrial fission 1 protein n=1 Tax=Engystomops pustulosus TaxID=76066 RepID=UPI003AFAEDAE
MYLSIGDHEVALSTCADYAVARRRSLRKYQSGKSNVSWHHPTQLSSSGRCGQGTTQITYLCLHCLPQRFEKKYLAELSSGSLSKSTQFEYAWCLIRSKYTDDIKKGVMILEDLLPKGSKDEQRDYLFYLGVAHHRLKEYEKALKYVRTLLSKEPKNTQALELEKVIEKKMQKEGLVGMAIVGGMALGVAGIAGLIGLAISKSK